MGVADRLVEFEQGNVVADPVWRDAGGEIVVRRHHGTAHLAIGGGPAIAPAGQEFDAGRVEPRAACPVVEAMRGSQDQILGDQRTGAEPAAVDIEASDGLPTTAIIAGIEAFERTFLGIWCLDDGKNQRQRQGHPWKNAVQHDAPDWQELKKS